MKRQNSDHLTFLFSVFLPSLFFCSHRASLYLLFFPLHPYLPVRVLLTPPSLSNFHFSMDFAPHIQAGASAQALLLRTIATECKPLVLSRPRCRTLKAKHLLLLTETKSECIVFAVEVYVYLLVHQETLQRDIFVSKADTTGLGNSKVSIAGIVQEFLRYLVEVPVSTYITGAKWKREELPEPETESDSKPLSEFELVNTLHELSEKLKNPDFYASLLFYQKHNSGQLQELIPPPIPIPDSVETKICLFTRSADSYIFPYSQKNSAKHIADGNNLFKWWINVLSKVLDDRWQCMADIPGSNARAVQRFLPDSENWTIGSIYVDSNPDEKAVYTIPLLPDDPKGRFLEHLIVENRYKSVTTKQFWEELGFRQEFRLGNVVGIISCKKKGTETLDGGNLDKEAENFKTDNKQVDHSKFVTLKAYKKIMETIKGEDFSKKEDIQLLTQKTIPKIIEDEKMSFTRLDFTGTKKIVLKPVEVAVVPQVNNLSGMVKKRAPVQTTPAVNNLTGLVKRKKT